MRSVAIALGNSRVMESVARDLTIPSIVEGHRHGVRDPMSRHQHLLVARLTDIGIHVKSCLISFDANRGARNGRARSSKRATHQETVSVAALVPFRMRGRSTLRRSSRNGGSAAAATATEVSLPRWLS